MMRYRPFVVLLVVGIVACGMLPVRGWCETSEERINRMEQEIEKTRQQLESEEKKLEQLQSREQQTLAELELAQKTINEINRTLQTLKNEEQSLTKEISAAQRRYDTAKAELDDRVLHYRSRLRSMYRRQHATPLAMIFSAGSMSSVLRGFTMLATLAEADIVMIDDLRGKSQELRDSMTAFQQALDAKTALTRSQQREQMTLASTRDKKREVIETIQQDEELQEQLLERLRVEKEESERALDEYIRELQRRITTVPSLEGYDFAAFKGTLPWPVSGKLANVFGREIDPRTKTETQNRGIEIVTTLGSPVSAIGDGQVVMTQFFRGYGNFVLLFHPPDYYSLYGHLSDILVNQGDVVRSGSVLGLAGSTGLIDEGEARLALEILKGDQPQNPVPWLQAGGAQVAR